MTTHKVGADLGFVEKWIAPRWKAVAGLLVSLVLGSATLWAKDPALRATLTAVVVPLLTAVGIHIAPANQPVLATVEDAVEGLAAPGEVASQDPEVPADTP